MKNVDIKMYDLNCSRLVPQTTVICTEPNCCRGGPGRREVRIGLLKRGMGTIQFGMHEEREEDPARNDKTEWPTLA